MKRLLRIVLCFSLIMGAVLLVFVLFHKESIYEERDILEYNEKLHEVEKALENGTAEEKIEDKYGCSIIFSKDIENGELAKMYRNGALVLDLTVNGDYVGKAAWDDYNETYSFARNSLFKASVFLWLVMLLCGYFVIFMFYVSFIRPVNELTKFSEEIAKGNLDEPLPIRKDNLFGNFVEAFDIMREELKISRQREIEAEIARKEMVADLSHDIKNPISIIKAACEVMEAKSKKKLSQIEALDEFENNNEKDTEFESRKAKRETEKNDIENTIEKVKTISQKADLISALVTNIMHTTLEDIDKLAVTPVETNSGIIKSFFDNHKNSGNIIMENEVPEGLVYMDRLRMEQVIDNIIDNSRKYAGTDIKVSFSETSALSADGEHRDNFIRITVKDGGPGVKEEDLPLITQKYYRGVNAKEHAGYGLGMYLVKRYMEMQLGGMEYYNDAGFTVQLLLKKV